MSAVGNCYASPQRHPAEIVNERTLTDRRFISGFKIPREINFRRRIHMNAVTDLCSKTAKQKSPPAEARPGAEPKKRCASVHNTRRVSSAEEYFRARRFFSTFSMRKTTKYEVHDYGTAGL